MFEELKIVFYSMGKCWEIGILLGYVFLFWFELFGFFMLFREFRVLVMLIRGFCRGSGSCGLFWKYCNWEIFDFLEFVYVLLFFDSCSILFFKFLIFIVGNLLGFSLIDLYFCCSLEEVLGNSVLEEYLVGLNLIVILCFNFGYFIGGKWR